MEEGGWKTGSGVASVTQENKAVTMLSSLATNGTSHILTYMIVVFV